MRRAGCTGQLLVAKWRAGTGRHHAGLVVLSDPGSGRKVSRLLPTGHVSGQSPNAQMTVSRYADRVAVLYSPFMSNVLYATLPPRKHVHALPSFLTRDARDAVLTLHRRVNSSRSGRDQKPETESFRVLVESREV